MGLKMAGIVLIIAGCGAWGLIGAGRISTRVKQLKELRLAMNFLEKEITCMYVPLPQALARTAQFCEKPISLLFLEGSRCLEAKTGATAGEAWKRGVDSIRTRSELKETDLKLITTVADQLGRSSADEQKKIFRLIDEELRIQEKKARQEMESEQKIWLYGGFMVGAVVVLLLI
ncbi:MAG: hypothetical protein ACOX0E_07760 [Syntrophomonadaceae bacterium]|jgi:stage III sporulation protein AB